MRIGQHRRRDRERGIDVPDLKKIELTGVEEWREYDFGGRVYRIDLVPASVEFYSGSTTHRVTGGDGMTCIAYQLQETTVACCAGRVVLSREPLWYLTKDGDVSCLQLYERHYSCYVYRDGRKRFLFAGPGEKIVLRTGDADALFVWRKFIDASGQKGINCSVFRNEGPHRSSELIRQADAIADHCWPGERHYTYVNPKAIGSSNPGYCFMAAGWRRCRERTQKGLRILER